MLWLEMYRPLVLLALGVLGGALLPLFVTADGVCEIRTTDNDDLVLSTPVGKNIARENAAAIDLDAPVVKYRDANGLKSLLHATFKGLQDSDTAQQATTRSLQTTVGGIQTAVTEMQSDLQVMQNGILKQLQSTIEQLQGNLTMQLQQKVVELSTQNTALQSQITALQAETASLKVAMLCPPNITVSLGSFCAYKSIESAVPWGTAMEVCANRSAHICSAHQMTNLCAHSRDNALPTQPVLDMPFPDEWMFTVERWLSTDRSSSYFNSVGSFKRGTGSCVGDYTLSAVSPMGWTNPNNPLRFICCRGF